MPVFHVHTIAGRSEEQNAGVITGARAAVVDALSMWL